MFGVSLETLVQALPFQCTMVPEWPTAQTSLAPLPQTPQRGFVVPLEAVAQALPFQCTMVPAQPTAQTSLAPLPQTPKRVVGVLLETLVQALPSQCKMVPDQPTAQTSLAPLPQTPNRRFPWGKGFRQRQFSALQTADALRKFWPVTFLPFTATAMLAGLMT